MQDRAIAIMLENPTARDWQVRGLDDYEDRLGELVPAWPELNDTLFWQNIKAARIRLERDGRQLNNVLQVQWLRHYWSFAADSFPRVLEWVRARELEDDRLVALSLAFRLYTEAERPAEWLKQLRAAVKGDVALVTQLDALLNPTVSEEFLKSEQRNMERNQEQERQSREGEQIRSDRIACLQSNPDLVRNPPGLELGQFSKSQFWLYREVEGSGQQTHRCKGAAWKSLIDEFGNDVACAYREAAMAHWRHYKPGLRSENPVIQPEGSSGSVISYSLLFAMAGLEIEAQEEKEFPEHLSESEVGHALRYITLELNGFPSWLEAMYRTYPQAVIDAIQTELDWELTNTQPGQPLHHILDDLNVYAPWLHTAIADLLLERMRAHRCAELRSARWLPQHYERQQCGTDRTRHGRAIQSGSRTA